MANQKQRRHQQAWDLNGIVVSGTSILDAISTSATTGIPTESSGYRPLIFDTSESPSPVAAATSTAWRTLTSHASVSVSALASERPSESAKFNLFVTSTATFAALTATTATTAASQIATGSTTTTAAAKRKSSKPSSALYISLMVLSILILLALITLAWFACRRKRAEKVGIEETTQRSHHAHEGSIETSRIPRTKTKESFQDSLSLTGPTLVTTDGQSDQRTLVPEAAMSTPRWPLMRSISRHKSRRVLPGLANPPAPPPPPKSVGRMLSLSPQRSHPSRVSAPPSSPVVDMRRSSEDISGLVGVHIPATHGRIDLSELSPVSPVSESELMRDRFGGGP